MNVKQNTQKVINSILDPFERFFKIEASGGIVLLIATIFALIWANSPWGHLYHKFWEMEISIVIGKFHLSESMLHWINDGLMAIFFFVVGLEIKRELLVGELSSFKKASFPIMAAIGGMLIPALLYSTLNRIPEASGGWGVPMATDIAFSLGVLSLLGRRVPLTLKVFLVAFAIVDDLGAVMIIALFYSSDIETTYLIAGLGSLVVLVLFNRLNIRYIPAYMIVGWLIWFFFLESGVHPTIAGVLIAFTIPMRRKIKVGAFRENMNKNMNAFRDDRYTDMNKLTHEQLLALDNMEEEIWKVQSPVQSLEHTLHAFVTFVVMPVFALSNAGIIFKVAHLTDIFSSLSGTIELSLVAGKVLGIFIFSWLSVKIGLASLPDNVNWKHILGLGFLGGMGFTMSLFISNLAFSNEELLNMSKIGILVGSLIAGILGYLILNYTLKNKFANA